MLGVNLHHLQPEHLAGEGDTRVNSAQGGGGGGVGELILTPLSPPPYLLQGPACPVDNL